MPIIDQTKRTGAGTKESPLTDIQIQDLAEQGYREGDIVPSRGRLNPLGYFDQIESTPVVEPTIAERLSRETNPTTIATPVFQAPTTNIVPSYTTIYGDPIDEEQIRRDTLRMFQTQIDATNEVYDQLLAESKIQGEDRLGSQRATAARGGILGSDFAGAQKNRILDFNNRQQRSIGAERQAAIGAILGNVRQSAADKIADQRNALQQQAQNYLDYLSLQDTNSESNTQAIAAAFLAQGIDPTTLSQTELANIALEGGVASGDILTNYQSLLTELEAQNAEDVETPPPYSFLSSSGGIFRTDRETGEATFIPGDSRNTSNNTSNNGFTNTQRNKLEAAGLLNSDREEQLKYLFGKGESDFEAARQIISNNPEMDISELKLALLENTNLSASEINALVDVEGESRQGNFVTENITRIAEKLREKFNYKDAIKYIEGGVITSKGVDYKISDEEKALLKAELENQRTLFNRIIPFGD